MTYALIWDLESIFPGGSDSQALQDRLAKLKDDIALFEKQVEKFVANEQALPTLLDTMALISAGFGQTSSFVEALQSSNVHDKKAASLQGILMTLGAQYSTTFARFQKKLSTFSNQEWTEILNLPEIQAQEIAFNLNELRRDAQELRSDAEEKIIHQLAIDGFHGWSSHYDTIVAGIEIPFEENGETTLLSAGQAFNRMMGDPDAQVRQTLFEKWEAVWAKQAPLFADTLNHLDGFRLQTQALHGHENHLTEPLRYNRMSEATLQAMWSTIQANKQAFVPYLTRKAQLFGKEKLEWQDQDAPILLDDFAERRYTFDEAAAFIIENFGKFSPKMAAFAKEAFEKSWIEAEDRPGKRPGGYCTSLPESQESRIFMTYGESVNEVATLAHELGHAFHSAVMWDLPFMRQEYAMNVAETASTFAELIVADATLKEAQTTAEKINLLDVKMANPFAMFLNIHSRFIFENSFYEARKKGVLSDEEITELMLAAQKEGYADGLATYHPHFWASKLHFFIDDVPFYNFPYTFGYMFSLGIYAYAQKQGGNFEDEYIALLRDTASMTTEELAEKHLGVDLTQPDFWQAGIDLVKQDIAQFLELTEKYV